MGNETFAWPIPQAASVGPLLSVPSVDRYAWMVYVAGILAFLFAWGIGANDVANAFATSVGAGSISLPVACVIAAVMEFSGSLLLGGQVTDTVRKKVINVDMFDPNMPDGAANGPEILMTGFLVALFSATTWLVLATYFVLPVSTTHSIIGSIMGVGIAYRGLGAVIWIPSDVSGFDYLRGFVGMFVSWLISPVLSGIFAVIFFLIVRTFILRNKEPYRAAVLFMPVLFGFTVALAIFFIVYKGDKRLNLSDNLGTGGAVGVALGVGLFVSLVSWYVVVPFAKSMVERWEQEQIDAAANVEEAKERKERQRKLNDNLSKVGINLSIEEDLDDKVLEMHDKVEKFDPKSERLFTWVQVFTAAIDSFAHGANDVANAIAPFSSVLMLYRNNGVISVPKTTKFKSVGTFAGGERNGEAFTRDDGVPDGKAFCGKFDGRDYFKCANAPVFPALTPQFEAAANRTVDLYDKTGALTSRQVTCFTECNPRNYGTYAALKQDVPLWIIAMGGAGIVAGLAMWGYRIIQAIGVKLTKMTPSRGFTIEIGAAITTLLASEIGIPVSTTHCQVGATMGVGLIEGKVSTVNWKHFFFISIGWVFTVIFTGFLSTAMFLIIVSSPTSFSVPQGEVMDNNLNFCPGNRFFVYDNATASFRGVACSGFNDSFLT